MKRTVPIFPLSKGLPPRLEAASEAYGEHHLGADIELRTN